VVKACPWFGQVLPQFYHEPPIKDATIPQRIEVNLRELGQLFNTMAYSSF
jgi:hypothetical protein